MYIILARHGNTFSSTEKPVWVGARTDLNLVEKGMQQAAEIATGLETAHLTPSRIYAGPLKRTLETAKIVANQLGLPVDAIVVSAELREIDYGRWEARSNDEIRSEIGDGPIDAWQRLSIWPEGFDWSPSESEIIEAWHHLFSTITHDNPMSSIVLVVSSNGIFRIVAKILGLPAMDAKMATGSVALLAIKENEVRVVGWNLDPTQLFSFR